MQKFTHVMRSVVAAGSLMVAAFGGMASAQAAISPAGTMEYKLVAVCKAIKEDNRIALYRAVRDSGVSYQRLADGLVCNGMDMYTFAQQHGAQSTGDLIARRTNLEERTMTAKQ